ncbi:MAG: Crp/Fnr family transcriptional regulator [Thermomicrobiales bacterium]
MDLQSRKDLLRNSPYFSHLDDAVINAVCRSTDVRSCPSGARIFTEGHDEGEAALHFVVEGVVKVYKLSTDGREQVLRLFYPGDTFADVAAFDGGPYPASADAFENATVLRISRRMLQSLMQQYPEIAVGASQIMAARLRHMTSLVEDLSLRRVMSRVARLLMENRAGAGLTQTQMATMVGTAREMVNRSLRSLEDQGAIQLTSGGIAVLDTGKLAEIVEAG